MYNHDWIKFAQALALAQVPALALAPAPALALAPAPALALALALDRCWLRSTLQTSSPSWS